jgi:hypothetical protein
MAQKKSNLLQLTGVSDDSWFIFVSLGRSLNTQQTHR